MRRALLLGERLRRAWTARSAIFRGVCLSPAAQDLGDASPTFKLQLRRPRPWSSRSNLQVPERRHRVGLGPQSDFAGGKAPVAMIEQCLVIEPAPQPIAAGGDADGVPLPEGRRGDVCRGELAAA